MRKLVDFPYSTNVRIDIRLLADLYSHLRGPANASSVIRSALEHYVAHENAARHLTVESALSTLVPAGFALDQFAKPRRGVRPELPASIYRTELPDTFAMVNRGGSSHTTQTRFNNALENIDSADYQANTPLGSPDQLALAEIERDHLAARAERNAAEEARIREKVTAGKLRKQAENSNEPEQTQTNPNSIT